MAFKFLKKMFFSIYYFCGGLCDECLNFDFHEWIQYILQVGSGVTIGVGFRGLQLRFESQHWRFWDWTSI
jgi:hypothetical protein